MALQSIKTSPVFTSSDNTRIMMERRNSKTPPIPPVMKMGERTLSKFDDFHRDLSDGGFRGAIFGFSDGLGTNLCLVVGVQVALGVSSPHHIILTGIAGLLAGAFSMGCGEYISMKAQSEAMQNEINREREHLKHHWDHEMAGLRRTLKESVQLQDDTLNKIVEDLSQSHRENVLTFHAKMELGIDPEDQGSPWKAAIFSFICFSIGAFIPLIPYFIFSDNNISYKVSIAISVFISMFLGYGLGKLNGVVPLNTTLRQVFAIVFSVVCSVGINFGFSKA